MNEANRTTRKFAIGIAPNRLKVHVTVSRDEGGRPMRVGMKCGVAGSLERALFCAIAEMMTVALERGVPLKDIARRFHRVAFDPAGPTGDAAYPMATSILDYVGHWMEEL